MIARFQSTYRFAMLLLVAALSCCLLHAVPVRVLAWDDEVSRMHLALSDSKGTTKIDGMHPAKRTGFYELTGGDQPSSIVALDKLDREGKPCKVTIPLPDGIKKPLLVILPDTNSEAGVRPFLVDDDSSAFAFGTTRFINATGKALVFSSGKNILKLPPSWIPVVFDPGGDSRNIEVKLFLRDLPDRAIYSSVWDYDTEVRTLIFLVPGKGSRLGPVAMKMIPEDRRHVAISDKEGQKELDAR